ncbi:MAG: phosphodiester glycosidase family protein [Lachnospiraceae bacterium]|nr:phosphodiester glycosidase family protein [Lachnospiraceae bacterium]
MKKSKKNTTKKTNIVLHIISGLSAVIFIMISLCIFYWMIFNIHPAYTPEVYEKSGLRANMSEQLNTFTSNNKINVVNQYLSEDSVIRKIYKIPEGTLVPAKPNPECYGELAPSDASMMQDVIDQAKKYGLLEGQNLVFDPNQELYQRGKIKYYLDETILVICWKELIDNRLISFVEVKVSDGSQFRRKIAGDSYSSSMQYYCTELTSQSNAVVGLNADFYAFRNLGITCFDGTIYRFGESPYEKYQLYNCLDTLWVDKNGDFSFFERGTATTKEDLQQYVTDNDIKFCISFGPILVKDGVAQTTNTYPIGQTNENYSRAGIGQVDARHYLYMMVGNEGPMTCTTNEFAVYMQQKGVIQGYNMDGGQTGEIVMNGTAYNYIDFGNERAVSDIIYFATALEESE